MTTRPEIDLTDGTFYGGDPFGAFAWMRANEPVYRDVNGIYGVTRYGDVKAVSKDPGRFSSGGGIRADYPAMPFMIDMDAPEHRRRRKLVSGGFTPRKVSATEDWVRRICDEIIDKVCEAGTCDFVRDIAAPLPMIVIGDLLGVSPGHRDDLLRWSDQMLKALGSPEPGAMDGAAVAFGEYSAYMMERIEERRASGDDSDLIGTLVHAVVDGDRLDDDSLIFETLLILVGGDETTRHVISGGMEALMRHRDQFDDLGAEAALLPGAVEEMLRWVSPIKNMARTVARRSVLGGRELEEGAKLLLLYPSANRDEAVFKDPESFDIRRQPNDHVAFGFGAHFCLGNSLARVELRNMIGCILERLPDIRRAADEELPLRQANFVSGIETMSVEFSPSARRLG